MITLASGTGMNIQGTHTRDDGSQELFLNNWTFSGPVLEGYSKSLSRITDASDGNGDRLLLTAEDDVDYYYYTSDGRLRKIVNPHTGHTVVLSYDANGTTITDDLGHSLQLQFDANGHLTALVRPDGTSVLYGYDGDNLASVTYPSGKSKQYLYENASFPTALTGMIDENGVRAATWGYDGAGRVNDNSRADGIDHYGFVYNADGTTTVTNPLGKQSIYHFVQTARNMQVSQIEGVSSATCPYAASSYTYDANGNYDKVTDWAGHVTQYVINAQGQQLSRTEAQGTPQERTVTTTWNATFNLPDRIDYPEYSLVYTYDTEGRVKTRTLQSTDGTLQRTRAYTYDPTTGQVATVDGPRTDVTDVTTYGYDSSGNLASITNAQGQVTQLQNYAGQGLPQLIIDANGTHTEVQYDWRGQVTQQTLHAAQGDAVTSYTYNPVGKLTRVDLPDGNFLTYEYDDAHRLTAMQNAVGERIEYDLDAMGDVTQERIKSADGSIKKTEQRVYDELGRLLKLIKASTATTQYAYDPDSNLIGTTDANSQSSSRDYDALNRLVSSTDASQHDTLYDYDSADRLTGVTDPRSLKTTYHYNALGDLTQTDSPDTGTTLYTYDDAGNRKTQTDARGVVTQYQYDALNRLTAVTYPGNPAENVSYIYDETYNANKGIGHLTSVLDESGSTQYQYDDRGNLVKETRLIESQTAVTQYAYDLANKLTQITYPSGRIVYYDYDTAGRISGVRTQENASAAMVTLVSNVSYLPFGQMSGWTYGNGQQQREQFDQDYQLTDIQGAVLNRHYDYDPLGNVSGILDNLDSSRSQGFGYDALSRLTSASGLYGQIDYTYDAVGNRLTRHTVLNGHTTDESYSYDTASNRLQSLSIDTDGSPSSRSLGYLANGQISSDQRPDRNLSLVYNQQNRLQEIQKDGATQALYLYNALGQRVVKVASQPSANLHFQYGSQGELLGESQPDGTAVRDYMYLNGTLVAQVAYSLNQAPVISSSPVTTATEGQTYSYAVTATDANNDPLTYSLTTAPAGMSINASGMISWTPTSAQVGSQAVTVRVSDGQSSTPQSFSITVASANQAPVISSSPVTAATEGQAYSYPVIATDADNDPLSYSLTTAPAGMTIDVNGLISWTPSSAQVGSQAVTVSVSDGQASTPQNFSVTVAAAPNQAPVITSTAPVTATVAIPYSYAVQASDADGDPLTYALSLAPAGMTIASDGLISWTPDAGQTGSQDVVVEVQDGQGGNVQQAYSISVGAPVSAYSVHFSGDDVGSIPALNLTGDYDIEFAFTPDAGNNSDKYRILGHSGNWGSIVEPHLSGFLVIDSAGYHTFSAWHCNAGEHAVAKLSRRNGSLSLYKNGTLVGTMATSGSLLSNQIGRTNNTDYFLGVIDYLRITNLASSSDSREYEMDEGSGTTLNDTSNGLNGSLVGTPEWLATP